MAQNALRIGIVVAIIAAMVFWYHQRPHDHKPPPELSGSEWLDICSPFESFDDRRMFDFVPKDHSVKYSKEEDADDERGVLFAKHPAVAKGTWKIDEATRVVQIDLDASHLAYRLVLPAGEMVCVLVPGPLNSVDLSQSYFGEPDFSDYQ